jgi:hypothetical protein
LVFTGYFQIETEIKLDNKQKPLAVYKKVYYKILDRLKRFNFFSFCEATLYLFKISTDFGLQDRLSRLRAVMFPEPSFFQRNPVSSGLKFRAQAR